MSIFKALPPARERVEMALRRDLSSRVARDQQSGRWDGYVYGGGADLLLRHGRFWVGRSTPEDYQHLRGALGKCFGASLSAALEDSRLTYVEGYCTTGKGYPFVHGWCIDADGVVELTEIEPSEHPNAIDVHTRMTYLPRERWGYWGVTFTSELAEAHLNALTLPMLDRSGAERVAHAGDDNYVEPHDFPILRVPYDPNRRSLP